MRRIHQSAVLDAQAKWEGYFSTITQGFASTLQGMLAHTTSFKQGMAQIGQQLMSQFLQQEAKKLSTYLAGRMAELTAERAKAAAKHVLEAAAAAKSMIIRKAQVAKQVASDVGIATANGIASMAGAPFPANTTAPLFGAAMGAAAGSAGAAAVAVAEQGWERVPNDGARALLHKDEMVLPARVADSVRSMAEGGGGGGANHYHIHAMDAQSFDDFLRRNESTLVKRLNRAVRDGNR